MVARGWRARCHLDLLDVAREGLLMDMGTKQLGGMRIVPASIAGMLPPHRVEFHPDDPNTGRVCARCGFAVPAGTRHVHADWCQQRPAATSPERDEVERRGAARAFRQAADECDVKAAKKAAKAAAWRAEGDMKLAVRAEESAHQMTCLARGFRHLAMLEEKLPERADRMRARTERLAGETRPERAGEMNQAADGRESRER